MIQNFNEGYPEISVDAEVVHFTDTKEIKTKWALFFLSIKTMEVLGEFKWTETKNEQLYMSLKSRNPSRGVQHRRFQQVWTSQRNLNNLRQWWFHLTHHMLSSVDWHAVMLGMDTENLKTHCGKRQQELPTAKMNQASTQLTAYTVMAVFPLMLLKERAIWYCDFYFCIFLLITWWYNPSRTGTLKGFCVSTEWWFLQRAL